MPITALKKAADKVYSLFFTMCLLSTRILAQASNQGLDFNYSQAKTFGNQTGLGKYIEAFTGVTMLFFAGLGILGVGWIALELLVFDKELRDIKKSVIGVGIFIVGIPATYTAMNWSAGQ
jgi:hypothetical protein